jgi:hypothetical protein
MPKKKQSMLLIDRLAVVWENLLTMALDDTVLQVRIATALDNFLDSLNADDFFGPGGQDDPRGDQRNDDWRPLLD